MPRRQILSSKEKEHLLIVPDDDVLLTRMSFLSEHDLALINKHRRSAFGVCLFADLMTCLLDKHVTAHKTRSQLSEIPAKTPCVFR